MPTALFVSPHLDDVAFSAGGAVIALGRRGWCTVVATAFTASVDRPKGFALACQLDKGVGPDVDYLALRRAEDEEFARRSGVARTAWFDLPEAPHRGYETPGALFGPFVRDDDVAGALVDALRRCIDDEQPDVVFAPQALGNHVDHRRVAEAVAVVAPVTTVRWYLDLPYAIRQPEARPTLAAVDALGETAMDITPVLDAKAYAATAYASQLPFQFGGATRCVAQLRAHAAAEAARLGLTGAVEAQRADPSTGARLHGWAEDSTGDRRVEKRLRHRR